MTHVYTRQHHTTGLQSPYEGPFRIAERTSRSTVKLEVGLYRDGSKRYEIRHLNDCKLAHPASLAAPASRPKLGRPSSATSDLQLEPEASLEPSDKLPHPPSDSTGGVSQNKQPLVATRTLNDHATSYQDNRDPSSPVLGEGEQAQTGPPQLPAFPARAARSTRNKNPRYVDAIWSASPSELALINSSING